MVEIMLPKNSRVKKGKVWPADKAANATSPQYTTLGNIVIGESGANKGDFATGTNKTLILTAPTGWSFTPGAGPAPNTGLS